MLSLAAAEDSPVGGEANQPNPTESVRRSEQIETRLRAIEVDGVYFAELSIINVSGKTLQLRRTPDRLIISNESTPMFRSKEKVAEGRTTVTLTPVGEHPPFMSIQRFRDNREYPVEAGEGFIKRFPISEALNVPGKYSITIEMPHPFAGSEPPPFTVVAHPKSRPNAQKR